MRTDRIDDAIAYEADQLAAEAFDEYPPRIEEWVRDAHIGEWSRTAEEAVRFVIWAAVHMTVDRNDIEGRARLHKAVEQLRRAYIDHAHKHGLYAAEAEDRVNSAISDEAERQRDIDIDQATLRG